MLKNSVNYLGVREHNTVLGCFKMVNLENSIGIKILLFSNGEWVDRNHSELTDQVVCYGGTYLDTCYDYCFSINLFTKESALIREHIFTYRHQYVKESQTH